MKKACLGIRDWDLGFRAYGRRARHGNYYVGVKVKGLGFGVLRVQKTMETTSLLRISCGLR